MFFLFILLIRALWYLPALANPVLPQLAQPQSCDVSQWACASSRSSLSLTWGGVVYKYYTVLGGQHPKEDQERSLLADSLVCADPSSFQLEILCGNH